MIRSATEIPSPELRRNPTKSNAHEPAHSVHKNLPLARSTAESAEHFALAARATNDALRDWDVKQGRLDWPQGLESLLGHRDSPIAHEIGFWQRHLHPEDRDRVAGEIRDALASGDHWNGEYRFRRADGVYLYLLERAVITRDDEGEAVRFFGSLMDITARQQLQDQLLRSQRMEAFGQLAAGVAHDFNNFLTTILGYSDLLLGDPAVKGQIAKHIAEIRNAGSRASALTSQLLAFSRKHPLDARVLEVNTLVTNIERSLLRLLGEDISVECDLHRFKDGGHIKVDPGQMTQIILNLVLNSRDAMPEGGKLKIETGALRVAEPAPSKKNSNDLAPGDYVTISVTDDGAGMSEEVKARLFEPFFSTKDRGTGSGLGLATSYGIVRQSGGHIRVASELGRGTTVTIYLPKVSAPASLSRKRSNGESAPTGTETVLVVEDDISVRHISVRVLRSLGYRVIEAASGDDAQRMIEEENAPGIHLLLTDIVMPQMSGRCFADLLRKASPKTKVVFISGYLDESLHLNDPADESTFFLPKPFDPNQLALKVRQALDAKG